MIPQIIVTVWLTVKWIGTIRSLGTDGTKDTFTSTVAATVNIAIPVVALYYGNFWSI
jgi:hypothetical protein